MVRPRRILFLVSSLPVGGAERQIQSLVSNMHRDRFVPILCCARNAGAIGEELKAAGLTFHSNLIRRQYDLSLIFQLRRLIKEEAIDLVYALDHLNVIVCGTLAASLAGKSIVIAMHATSHSRHGRGIPLATRLLSPFIARFIAVAETHRDYLVGQEGLDPGKIRVVYNGVDVDRFQSVLAASVREEFGIPDGALTAGIIAVLRREKAHEVFLEAASLVSQTVPYAYFLVVGDGPERQRLERRADALGIGSRVRFCGHRNDIPRLLAYLDVVVLSSDPVVETFPMALLEAMAAGRPAVATRVGSIAEMVSDGITGYLVPPRRPDVLAERMRQLLEDGELRAAMGARGRLRVRKRFTTERMVGETERLFEEVLNDPTGRERA